MGVVYDVVVGLFVAVVQAVRAAIGELTLDIAKAAAAANYASRYCEAEQLLDGLLDDWDDDDGPRTRRSDPGHFLCRVDEPGIV